MYLKPKTTFLVIEQLKRRKEELGHNFFVNSVDVSRLTGVSAVTAGHILSNEEHLFERINNRTYRTRFP